MHACCPQAIAWSGDLRQGAHHLRAGQHTAVHLPSDAADRALLRLSPHSCCYASSPLDLALSDRIQEAEAARLSALRGVSASNHPDPPSVPCSGTCSAAYPTDESCQVVNETHYSVRRSKGVHKGPDLHPTCMRQVQLVHTEASRKSRKTHGTEQAYYARHD